jgi:hypothetical protein
MAYPNSVGYWLINATNGRLRRANNWVPYESARPCLRLGHTTPRNLPVIEQFIAALYDAERELDSFLSPGANLLRTASNGC